MSSMGAGGSGSGRSENEKGKGLVTIWDKFGTGNRNWGAEALKITSKEEDDGFCYKLTNIYPGRVCIEELYKFPPAPPDYMIVGKSQKVQAAAQSYWLEAKTGSYLRRRIACLKLEGYVVLSVYTEELKRVQNSLRNLAEILGTEIQDFEDYETHPHSYILKDVVLIPKKQSEKSGRKSKGGKK